MRRTYSSMNRALDLNRREFAKVIGGAAAVAGGLVLGVPSFGEEKDRPLEVETNIGDFMKVAENGALAARDRSRGGWSR